MENHLHGVRGIPNWFIRTKNFGHFLPLRILSMCKQVLLIGTGRFILACFATCLLIRFYWKMKFCPRRMKLVLFLFQASRNTVMVISKYLHRSQGLEQRLESGSTKGAVPAAERRGGGGSWTEGLADVQSLRHPCRFSQPSATALSRILSSDN